MEKDKLYLINKIFNVSKFIEMHLADFEDKNISNF